MVGDEVADVGGGGAGGDGPVHVADVVFAGLVEAGFGEFGAGAGEEAEVFAVEEAVEAAGDLEFESAQGAFGGEVGEFAAAPAPGGHAVVTAAAPWFQTTRGGGTAARIWVMTSAVSMPSARASKVRTMRWAMTSRATAWTSSGRT